MELDGRGSGVRRNKGRRCPKMKRVSGQSGFTLRCHDATNIRRRERKKKRERQSEKSQTVDITRYRIEGMYA